MVGRRGLVAVLLLAVLAGGSLALHAAWGPEGVVTLSGPVSVWAALMGLDAAPMGLDARTHRAFFITDATLPGQPPTTGEPSHLDTLDTLAGTVLRSVRLGPAPFGLVVDEPTDRVFVADSVDGMVRIFDARSGILLRTQAIGGLAPNDLAVDVRTGRVFVASTLYNAVATLDARTGALLHTVRDVGDVVTVDAQTGRVFAFIANNGSGTNAVAVLDARSGALVRSVPVSQDDAPAQITVTAVGPVVTGATDYLLLDGRTGQIRRSIPVRVDQRVVAAVGGRLLLTDYYAGPSSTYPIVLFDPRTGQMVHSPMAGVTDVPQFAVDRRRGRVFAAGGIPRGSASAWMIDARSGRILHTEPIAGSPAAIALDARAGRVFVAVGATDRMANPIGPSGIVVLDARSGRTLRTIPLSGPPTALLVDEPAGHVIVVLGGNAMQTSNAWGWIPQPLRRWLPFIPSPSPVTRVSPSSVRLLDATD